MRLIGLARLGKDAEVRYTANGNSVCGFSAAWNYGQKDGDGKRPSQWVDLSMWGERGEAMCEHLTKGRRFYIIARDVHLQTYPKSGGGEGLKLVGTVETIEFADDKQAGAAPVPAAPQRRAPAPAPRQQAGRPSRPATGTGFDDMDDDIPF